MRLKQEIPLIIIVLLPFMYLAFIWNELPQKVPMHWNIEGEIDRYGDKTELIITPTLLPLIIYVVFLIIPKIDPKKQLNKMGNKLQRLKVLVTIFMSILTMYIIYSTKNLTIGHPNYIILLIGILYVILGNYFKTIRANYFIGIRTPWTLESDEVWKETHKLGGKLWFIGGITIVISSLILDKKSNLILFLSITVIISLIPIVYSYIIYRNRRKIKS